MLQKQISELTQKYNYKNICVKDAERVLAAINDIFKNKNIVIMGAGITGKFYYDLFNNLNIKIRYYTDKNADKINNINGTPIYTIEKLTEESEKVIAIAAGNPSMVDAISKDAAKLNLPRNVEFIKGDDLISVARCAYCLKNQVVYSECSICYNKECYCSAFTAKHKIEDSSKVSFPLIGYILGQVCTLKCKHCCESVPYLKNPIMVKTDQVIADLKKVAKASGFISRVEFIGGEPFLHKGLPEILKAVLEIKNVGYAMVFTNATVMPSDELIEVLKNPRVVVNFSGYKNTISDELKEKVKKTKQKLIDSGVNFAFYNPDSRNWLDINYYEDRKATPKQLKEYFEKCFMGNCARLFNGEFYCCPHYYSGIQLDMMQKYPYEYIEVHNYSNDELAELFVKFKQMDYPEACKYCNLPYDATAVEPAIQLGV